MLKGRGRPPIGDGDRQTALSDTDSQSRFALSIYSCEGAKDEPSRAFRAFFPLFVCRFRPGVAFNIAVDCP